VTDNEKVVNAAAAWRQAESDAQEAIDYLMSNPAPDPGAVAALCRKREEARVQYFELHGWSA